MKNAALIRSFEYKSKLMDEQIERINQVAHENSEQIERNEAKESDNDS